MTEKPPKGYLEVSNDQTWIPCLRCRKNRLVQLRKAFWKCMNCGQEIIADDNDMRPEWWRKVRGARLR